MESHEYEQLPENVKCVIDSFDEDCDFYLECKRISNELNLIGWQCDYDLSGQIFDVKPINKQ